MTGMMQMRSVRIKQMMTLQMTNDDIAIYADDKNDDNDEMAVVACSDNNEGEKDDATEDSDENDRYDTNNVSNMMMIKKIM